MCGCIRVGGWVGGWLCGRGGGGLASGKMPDVHTSGTTQEFAEYSV